MNVLVTGGAGYIGSATADVLMASGHQVVVYDNLSKGHRAAVPPAAHLVEGDVRDGERVRHTVRRHRIQACLHFAAFIEAGESMEKPEKYFDNNTAGSLALLQALLAEGVSRFVFSSTAALYGNPDAVPISEDAPLQPTNAYGESKLLVERMLEWFYSLHGFRYASLRYFNACGATEVRGEDHQPESHLIPIMLQVAQGQRPHVTIYGTDYPTPDGTCVRDYIHISDLASAHVLALEALERHGRLIYNLGNGQGFSVRQVLEAVRQVTGHPLPAVEGARRPGDPAALVASSDRIKSELGWRPRFPHLHDVVASAWRWRQAHPHGYERETHVQA